MLRCCYVIGWCLGGLRWGSNVHVTCVHTSCFAAATSLVEFGWGGLSPYMRQANAWKSETSRAEVENDHNPRGTKRCKYHITPSKWLYFPLENLDNSWSSMKWTKMCMSPQRQENLFFERCLTARTVSHPPGCLSSYSLIVLSKCFCLCWQLGNRTCVLAVSGGVGWGGVV